MSSRKFANAKKNQPDDDPHGITRRVRQVREARFGPRGQARFCKAIGVSPSTYHYYENSRVAPPDVLVRIAQVADTNLTWLLTGQGAMDTPEAGLPSPADQVLTRVGRLLSDRAAAGPAMAAFVELLEKIEAVERYRRTGSPVPLPVRRDDRSRAVPLIPVLGRTAASVPQFWNNPGDAADLGDQLSAAVAHLSKGERLEGISRTLDAATSRPHKFALIQLGTPVELADLSVAEVLQSRGPGSPGPMPSPSALPATRWPRPSSPTTC